MTEEEDEVFETMKLCSKCGDLKKLDSFYRDKYGKFGRCSRCIECSYEHHPRVYEPQFCRIDGCARFAEAKGLCNTHYKRLQRTGDPNTVRLTPDGSFDKWLIDCFGSRDRGECWDDWPTIGATRQTKNPHKALQLAGKDRPEGYLACHTCDNGKCCNPDHLWWGTPQENTLDAINKGRFPQKDYFMFVNNSRPGRKKQSG